MKKLLSILLLMMLFSYTVEAQQANPRFGITKNADNTGRILSYNLASLTDAVAADSVTLSPNAFQTFYKVALLDSFTLKQPVITNSYYGDEINLMISGASGTKLKFFGTNWLTTGSATLSTGLYAIITLRFNGSKWVEQSRVVQ